MFSSKKLLAWLLVVALTCAPVSAQVPMTGAGVGSPDDLQSTPVSTACTSSSGTTITFTAQGIGGANPNRTSVVSINWSDSAAAGTAELNTVTIGGISMVRGARASGDNQNSNSEIWYIANPTGTSANIVATFSTAVDGITIGVYSLVGYLTSPVASTTGTTSISQAYTTRQVALGAASRTVNVSTALSNMTNDFSSACGASLWGVHASQRLNGSGTLSSTISPTSNNPKIALVVWVATNTGGCSEATTWLARLSSPDATHISAYTNFVCGLVADGVWTKFDALYVFATQTEAMALLNLVSTNYAATKSVLPPTFTADRGFAGGLNATILSNFNPTTASSPKFVQNSAHLSAWSNNSVGNVDPGLIGYSVGGNEALIIPKYNDGNAYYRINSAGGAGVASSTAAGFFLGTRTNSSTNLGYFNAGLVLNQTSSTSVAVQNSTVYILGYEAGTVGVYQVSIASIGQSLTAGEITAFYNRAATYRAAVGVP